MTTPLSGRDALVATELKLHVPEPHGFVQHRRLAQALDDGWTRAG
jgi:hypothetical protein